MASNTYPCENCKFRASYDKNPQSAKGRFWRWHINWCPGWKNFFTHQDEETLLLKRSVRTRTTAHRPLCALIVIWWVWMRRLH